MSRSSAPGSALVVVSGGQSGVDRAALDVARELGLPVAGWCPAGGWAEDLPEPPGLLLRYPELRETPTSDPAQRTRWNVRDSDATLVLRPAGDLSSPGTRLATDTAHELGRPLLQVSLTSSSPSAPAAAVAAWLGRLGQLGPGAGVRRLRINVAGPRESEAPGIAAEVTALLRAVLAEP